MLASLPARKRAIFRQLFDGYAGPPFAVRLWDGSLWRSPGEAPPVCTIVLKERGALAALLAAPNELTLGEAFIRESLDVEGDLFSAFAIAEHIFDRPRSLRQRIAEQFASAVFGLSHFVQLATLGPPGSRRRDRASIAYHYDQPVEFFALWLGETLAYSCAYFLYPEQTLDQAQKQKLDLVCRKLRLEPGDHFLDIGCGWGSLPIHAAQERGAQAHGITLSREQARTAQRRIQLAGLGGCCSVELGDYRDLEGDSRRNSHIDSGRIFDKIASVGMFEHVGLKNLPLYFGIARRLLRPGGLMLNHGIARATTAPVRESSFVGKYVFPGGQLVTLPQVVAAAEAQGFEVRDVENLREHYELTLRCWVEGLRRNADALLRLVPKTTYRIWLLYTAGSAAAFRRGAIGLYQVLLSRPDRGNCHLPLTREDWYASPETATANTD
jgi:cyclopropane-fatty-acyl-phospholipid synthase